MSATPQETPARRGLVAGALDLVERVGNRLPDPAVLFLLLMLVVWALSWWLSGLSFDAVDPRTGEPIVIRNLLEGRSLTGFMAAMVNTFVTFPPLGVVLVAMLGLGVAEHTGFVSAALRAALTVTPRMLLTPMLIAVGVLSHVAVDAGYVLVIPLGAVIFYAAGRHPLAGIAAAFAGVSGGFSATFVPSSLDPLLSGLSTSAAQLIDPTVVVSPLNNYFFTTASTGLVVLVGWFLTDRVIEPRLRRTPVDGDPSQMPKLEALDAAEKRGLAWALASMAVLGLLFVLSLLPEGSPWRAPAGTPVAAGQSDLLVMQAPVMQSIVPLIFIFFLVPGVIYGMMAGSVKNHRDVVKGMSKAMSGMGYYVVMAFFCAQFIWAFGQSNLGALIAVEGASGLRALGLPLGVTLVGIVLLSAFVNLMVGSASAKWALIGAIMVPMLMELGVSPDLTQAAYRVGDSSTNIITPLLPYFPLIVVFCQRYVQGAGIGTLLALMLPYSLTLLVCWSAFLLGFWALEIPLGWGASYEYLPPGR
ncbi:AbgT family transporter [Arenimonas fontis]|uniref:AbgT family transporter n=1 Tax=Arenimonas fontis TaxID=2608255 RepID=A0A5B2ZE98_9GAMM|nr:AbgT family transporter [Arenimonas fontis]KAA2285392.1 AbgT family transporter [Arenimonas fontis]